jgi:hypothetical protein
LVGKRRLTPPQILLRRSDIFRLDAHSVVERYAQFRLAPEVGYGVGVFPRALHFLRQAFFGRSGERTIARPPVVFAGPPLGFIRPSASSQEERDRERLFDSRWLSDAARMWQVIP